MAGPLEQRLLDVVTARGQTPWLALMRALFGLIVIRHFWPDLTAAVLPVERFHVPWWSWVPVPSAGAYRAIVVAGVVAGGAMTLGAAAGSVARRGAELARRGAELARRGAELARRATALASAATVVALAAVVYLMVVDMTAFAHNRSFLVWLLLGLALLRADSGPASLWPVTMMRFVVTSVYLTSGVTKLANPDWLGGVVLWDRVNRYAHRIPFDGALADLLTGRSLFHVLAPAAIAIELFLACGLWFRRTRPAAVVVAVVFHVSIELVASVQTFSYSALAALLLWATPRECPATPPKEASR